MASISGNKNMGTVTIQVESFAVNTSLILSREFDWNDHTVLSSLPYLFYCRQMGVVFAVQ